LIITAGPSHFDSIELPAVASPVFDDLPPTVNTHPPAPHALHVALAPDTEIVSFAAGGAGRLETSLSEAR
jgi:hypothetical protein